MCWLELQTNLREDYAKFYNHREGLIMKALVGSRPLFLVGAFSVIVQSSRNLREPSFGALVLAQIN